jgi:hypothetical protein
MRELQYLINEVREQTDNEDTNGVSDREIIRYFNDAIKSVQAIVFKNNPLCSYFQKFVEYQSPTAGRSFQLPDDCFAYNAVTFVEVLADSSINDLYSPLQRCFQEDQNSFQGWFTRNKEIYFTGTRDISLGYSARVWYFNRIPKWTKVWGAVNTVVGQSITINNIDSGFTSVDKFISFIAPDGTVRAEDLTYTFTAPSTIVVVGDVSSVQPGDRLLVGKNTSLEVDLPDEVEPYILDYVAKRIYGRNNYKLDGSKIEYFTQDDRVNITSIFADASQSVQPTPITDTSYLTI